MVVAFMLRLLESGPKGGIRLLLAHGAGAPMDSAFMNAIADKIAAAGVGVVRFEFEYMARRRDDGVRRGPDRPPKLVSRFQEALGLLGPPEAVVIGGKSMGGRIASMIADGSGVAGLVCLGYPFHPPGKPERLRIAHLESIETPTLIIQGTRDPFGTPEEVQSYSLSPSIELVWIPDGNHSFEPRKKTGRSLDDNLRAAANTVVDFIRGRG
jgi:predicted alpha/beta-hydrolase family hydrolase